LSEWRVLQQRKSLASTIEKRPGNCQKTLGIIIPQKDTQGEEYRPRVFPLEFGMATLASEGIEGIGLHGTAGIGT
jgi:hypothetical protein